MTPAQAANLSRIDGWFRYWMPYSFVQIDHAKRKHVWLPLNRIYKPLGITGAEHVNYADFIAQAIAFKADPRTFTKVWHIIKDDQVWLYSDGPTSRLDYFDRLRAVMIKSQVMVQPADELAADDRSWTHSGREAP